MGKQKRTKGAGIAIIFTMAAVWFGAEMGGGTASGANMMNFFVKVGWIGLWLSFVATCGEGWYFYWGNEMSRMTGKTSYADWLHELWYPIDKIMVPILDVFILLTYPIFISSTISGVATLLQTYFGVQYTMGVIVVTVSFIVLTVVGIKMIQAIGTVLTVLIIAIIAVVLVIGIPKFWPQVVHIQQNHIMGEGYTILGGIGLAFSAWGQQASLVNVSVSTWTGLKNKNDVKKAVIVGVILLLVVKFGLTLLLQGRWPGNLDAPIYILEATNAAGSTMITLLYPILLAGCFISTGPVMIYAQTDRWSKHKFWDKLSEGNLFRRHKVALCTIFFTGIAFLLAQFDFNTITGVIQVYAAYFWLFLFGIPISIICPLRVRRMRKEQEKTGKITLAEDRRAQKAACQKPSDSL